MALFSLGGTVNTSLFKPVAPTSYAIPTAVAPSASATSALFTKPVQPTTTGSNYFQAATLSPTAPVKPTYTSDPSSSPTQGLSNWSSVSPTAPISQPSGTSSGGSGGAAASGWVSPAGVSSQTPQFTQQAQISPTAPFTSTWQSQPTGQLPPGVTNPYQVNPNIFMTPPTGVQRTPQQQQVINQTLMNKGYLENWWEQNQGAFRQPSLLQGYYNDIRPEIMGMNVDPRNSQAAYDAARANLSGEDYGMQTARNLSTQLQGNLQGEQYFNQAGQYYQQPNLAYNYAQQNLPFFGSGTNSQGYYDQVGGQLQQAGQGETAALNTGLRGLIQDDVFTQPGLVEDWGQYATGELRNAGIGEQMVGSELPGLNTVGNEQEYFSPLLRNKSYSEQLYESGNEGLNTWYERERERQQTDLEDRMAAMGVFGSGETAKGMYELRAELGAQQARDMAGLAGQADQSMFGRAGLAGELAQASSQEDLARMGMGLDLDQLRISRMGAGTAAADAASRFGLDRVMGAGKLTEAADRLGLDADRLGLDRLGLGGDLAGQADEAELARRLGGSTVAEAGDRSMFAQGAGLRDLGAAQTEQERLQLEAAGDLALARDQEERLRQEALMREAGQLDQGYRDSQRVQLEGYDRLYNAASERDRQRLAELEAERAAAELAQRATLDRSRALSQDTLAGSSAMANYYGTGNTTGSGSGGVTGATGDQAAMSGEAINLLMSKYGMTAQQAEQQAQQWAQLGQLASMLPALRSAPKMQSTSTGYKPVSDPSQLVSGYFK